MRPTLRRSCAACAKYKHSCDLRTPRCSRCIKRNVPCVYANQPLTAPPAALNHDAGSLVPANGLSEYRFGSLDPFDSYPPTRLPREHVQRLVYSFLHKIAFQYYPLDLNATSNPFLVSWWPLALGDPALFHVSLQTACLDEELLAQKGFHASEILMADSVALLRRKVQDPSLAVQDGTMNSVITLAAIEFGKGNIKVSRMHVDGAKKLVEMRGGINSVRQTSPLTARMISWVSMLVMGHPQFPTQDDVGIGDGIPLVPEWQLDMSTDDPYLQSTLDLIDDVQVRNAFARLRNVFNRAHQLPLSSTRLHDLACFVIHRLLSTNPSSLSLSSPSSSPSPSTSSPITESIRYTTILYMFIIHGPTYYSHDFIMGTIVTKLITSIANLDSISRFPVSIDVWFLAIGLVASSNTPNYQWFSERAQTIVDPLQIQRWDDVVMHVKTVLWLETPQAEAVFRTHWDAILPSRPVVVTDITDMADLAEADTAPTGSAAVLPETVSPNALVLDTNII